MGICSPSGTIAHRREALEKACVNFEQRTGLHCVVAPNALARHFYSAGTPAERLEDFHYLLAREDVRAILFSAGGDTAIDLVPLLPYDEIRQRPKIMAGISDATTLLSPITAKTGLVTFLGLEFLDFADHPMPYTLASIEAAWFSGQPHAVTANPGWQDLRHTDHQYRGWQAIRPGAAEGRLIGGNFQSFMQLMDTEYELMAPGALLFLETYRLSKKEIHKGLLQLKLRGVLEQISGMIVGYCCECDMPAVRGNEQALAETIREACADYTWPIMQVGEIGHWVENCLQPLGAQARMDADALQFEITESVAV